MTLSSPYFNETLLWSVLLILTLALVFAFGRLMRGPGPFDRLLALDMVGTVLGCLAVVSTLTSEDPVFLDAAVILVLVSFLASVIYSRHFIRRVGR